MYNILNEGFKRKYLKEDLFDSLKREIKRKLKAKGYNVDVEGAEDVFSGAAEYIEQVRDYEPDSDYTVDEWIRDTEFNYPQDLAFMLDDDDEDEFEESCSKKLKEEKVENEVFHNDNGDDYDIIERSKSGQNALLNRGKQWIIAWNCPKSNEGSWGQGHYFFDEKSAREVWEDKYLNEDVQKLTKYNDRYYGLFEETSMELTPFGDYTPRRLNNGDIEPDILLFVTIADSKEQAEKIFRSNGKFTKYAYVKPISKATYDKYSPRFELLSLKETLENKDYAELKSDVYNALSDIVFEYHVQRGLPLSQSDIEKAIEWFELHFFEDEFDECIDSDKLKEFLENLNEAEMSDEDKKDSEILWNIYNKTQQRANAKLTDEEKATLNKYNLTRVSDLKDIYAKSDKEYMHGAPLITQRIDRQVNNWRSNTKKSNVNLADRARKMNDRGQGYGYHNTLDRDWTYDSNDHREYKDSQTGKYVRLKNKGLLDAERDSENIIMQTPVNRMKNALDTRNQKQKSLASIDARFDAEKAKAQQDYEKKLADIEKSRKWNREWDEDSLNSANATINKLLKKDEQ